MIKSATISPKEARRIHRAFSRQQQQYEKAATKVFYVAIRDQIKQFIAASRDYPSGMERQAVNEINPLNMARAFKKVAIRVGVGYMKITEAEMTAEESEQKSLEGRPQRGLGHIVEVEWNQNPYDTKENRSDDRAMIEAYLRLFGAKKVVGVTETTQKWIAQQVVDGQQAGLTFEQVAKNLLNDDINAKRALRIARTETVGMMNLGRYIAANKSNFEKEKIWIDAHDDKVRPGVTSEDSPFDHHASEIKIATKLNMLFRVSGEYLMFPGDSSHGASAGNIINCRCTFALQSKRDEHGRLVVKPRPMTVTATGTENFPEGIPESTPQLETKPIPTPAPVPEFEPQDEIEPESTPTAQETVLLVSPSNIPTRISNLIQQLMAAAQLGSLLGMTFESLFGLPQNQDQ